MSLESNSRTSFELSGVCLVVPCYNEGIRIDCEAIRTFLAAAQGIRLVFVDDGSTDATGLILGELRSEFPGQIELLTNKANQGKAESVRRGIDYTLRVCQPECIGYWDADLAAPLQALRQFQAVLASQDHIDLVFGSRVKLSGRAIERRPIRHYLGRVFATAASVFLELPVYDTQCGAKIFRVRPETASIFADRFVSRWVFDVEIIARYAHLYGARQAHSKLFEFPLDSWRDVGGSKVRPIDFFKAFFDLVRIRAKYKCRPERSAVPLPQTNETRTEQSGC